MNLRKRRVGERDLGEGMEKKLWLGCNTREKNKKKNKINIVYRGLRKRPVQSFSST